MQVLSLNYGGNAFHIVDPLYILNFKSLISLLGANKELPYLTLNFSKLFTLSLHLRFH